MTFSSPTFSPLMSLVMIFCSFFTIFANINRISMLLSALCTWCLANHIEVLTVMPAWLLSPLGLLPKDLHLLLSKTSEMNICFYFALRVSTLIFSVLITGKEYYPIRTLIELTIISKIYNPRLNIFLMLITRTSTAWLCVGVCNTYIYAFKTTIWR